MFGSWWEEDVDIFKDLQDPTEASKPSFSCDICGKSFTTKGNLKQHAKTHSDVKPFECTLCNLKFNRNSDLTRHGKSASHLKALADPTPAPPKRKDPPTTAPAPKRRKNNYGNCKRALDTFFDFVFRPQRGDDLAVFLTNISPDVTNTLEQQITALGPIKWYVVCHVEFSRMKTDIERETTVSFFRSKCVTDLTEDSLEAHVETAFEKVKKSCEDFERNGSGWQFEKVLKLELKVAKYVPLAASTYFPLPPALAAKKAVLNIQNSDSKCFLWSVLAALHPVSREEHAANRVSNYVKYEHELNLDGISFPTPVEDIEKFEKMNNISVNVFAYEDEVFPRRISKMKCDKHVNLLWLSNGERQHYCLIRNMSRLLGDLTKHKAEAFYCNYCLHRFSSQRLLDEHADDCIRHGEQKIKMPSENEKWLQFDKYNYQMRIPFVIYADFESILVKVHSCPQDPTTSHSEEISNHIACGYGYVIIGPDGKAVKPPKIYRGENAVDHFLSSLLEEEKYLETILKKVQPMRITAEEEKSFQSAANCHICGGVLAKDRVRDHDHVTGEYRGAAHSNCNLNFKVSFKIPVILHNSKCYDTHLIMQGIGKIKNRRIECIATNMEKYVTFSLGKLHFLDSFQFLSASLQRLVNNLNADQFKILKDHVPSEKVHLLLRKGVYPYEYMDSFKKFQETTLPSRTSFYSRLTEEDISEEDYLHAQKVWKEFNVRHMGEYHDIYLQTDILLLADVFENFRDLCMQHYGLDPCHVYTAPGLAWHAMLKCTGVRLELLTDPNMHIFIEKGIRGGISMISNRYAKANNKYLMEHDSDQPSKYIMYLDMNNLYGKSMTEKLPIANFKWADDAQRITAEDILRWNPDAEEGYILEVDLEYPSHLHDLHNDYPLAPENLDITPNMLSPFVKTAAAEKNMFRRQTVRKLTPNLYGKEKYVLHYRNLQLYLTLGMKLIKVHRALKFEQKAWLRKYIEFNTEQRKKAKNSFQKDFFKLMNNAVFGKTMENLRNRANVHLVQHQKRARKLIASPAFHAFTRFNEELVAIKMKKPCLLLNRPIYAGFTILDLSKTLMYKFHYHHIVPEYRDRVKLLFTDTDSLCYEIRTEDVYSDMKNNLHLYDTSDYPHDHRLYSEENKKVLGKMKDELNGKCAEEFVGLRPKMYSLKTGDVEKKTAKGVARYVVEKRIRHKNYKDCLFSCSITRETIVRIASKDHHLKTVASSKIALSPLDDKRYILDNGIDTLAYGHYKIKM